MLKMLKKSFLFALIIALVFAMTACGGEEKKDETVKETTTKEQAKEDEKETTEAKKDDKQETTEAKKEEQETTEAKKDDKDVKVDKSTIEKQVLFEEKGIKVTALKLVQDDIMGPGIKLLVENNSDKDINISSDNISINDYMIESYFSSDVSVGKKVNDTLYFEEEEIANAGIKVIEAINLQFKVYDKESYDEIFTTDLIVINTSAFGTDSKASVDVNTDGVDGMTIEPAVLFEQDNVKVTSIDLVKDDYMGIGMRLMIENNSDKNINLRNTNLVVNDYAVESYFSKDIGAGKKRVATLFLLNDVMTKAGMDTIADMILQFQADESASYAKIFETEPFIVKTSKADSYQKVKYDDGLVIFEQDGFKVTVVDFVREDGYGADMIMHVENNTDEYITVNCEELSINGFMMDTYFSGDIPAGKLLLDYANIFEENFTENEIEEVESVSFKLIFRKYNDYKTMLETEELSFTIE